MAKEIVKVQVPLEVIGDNADPRDCLIYDRGRKHMSQQHLDKSVLTALGGDKKGFFEASWDVSTGWVIGERVEDQAW
jgi:hypothetical protein